MLLILPLQAAQKRLSRPHLGQVHLAADDAPNEGNGRGSGQGVFVIPDARLRVLESATFVHLLHRG